MSEQTRPENQEAPVQHTDDAEIQTEELEEVAGGDINIYCPQN